MKRTHTCGGLDEKSIGKEAVIEGWVGTMRDHGPVTFIDVRDRYGVTQTVFSQENGKKAHGTAKQLGREFVVRVKGKVERRPKGTENTKISTGKIELRAEGLEILNSCETLPIEIEDETRTGEEQRLKYRYLDLRRPVMQKNIMLRHRIVKAVRDYFDSEGFVEIETPILAKSTPEGARDYLVPSRVHPGKFFALPQSPQLFKQMLMLSGFDRYVQFPKCLRDEDLRADRQPEFTQVDVEMSFVDEEDIFCVIEGALKSALKQVGKEIKTPFPRMPYDEAMARFGTDRPDTRFGFEIVDVTKALEKTSFEIFKNAVKNEQSIKAINAKGCASFSRKDIDKLAEIAKIYRAKGIITAKITEKGFESSVEKHLDEKARNALVSAVGAKKGDLVVIVADKKDLSLTALGAIRLHLSEKLGLVDRERDDFLWVTDFPLFAWGDEEQKIVSTHHPFTHPKEEDIPSLDKNPLSAKSRAYDVVWNGIELGGGSIRIHDPKLQQKIFSVLGLSEEEANQKFGFMLNAFKYGAPPHGGIALGLDRLIMLIVKAGSLREIIAFPKNKSCVSLMEEAPSPVSEQQLRELKIRLDAEK